ncbi:MSHA biogenesis protein MshA [Duganella sp. FT94W]|uniref:MSHA biogenesis protein MshA n=1 Tax=Duganella lactea TaxID=2692173 RepID=A0ABW9V4T2_9BURK|nr:MSHA biogenesis protein MshA [Duganella lactea]MYM34580.1 MSHA biogenesis protein MshA [Duganella lactea]
MSQQINLFNPIFLKQKKIFSALPMLEALGAIIVGALLLNWYAAQTVDQLERVATEGKATLAKREQQLAKASKQFAPRVKDAVLETDLAEAEAELVALREVSTVLQGGSLGNTLGYAEYFRAFSRQNVNGLWLTGLTISGAGTDIGVQGRAMHATLIPNYISRLTAERVMHGKTFASLDIGRPGTTAPPAPQSPPVLATTVAGLTPADPVTPATPAAPAVPAAQEPPFVEFNLQSTLAEEADK